VTPNDLPFEEVWLHDFEYVARPGERPDVVCLAARELRSGRTLKLWRDELGELPPYRTDRGALFVCFVANAECACHLSLGWPLPARALDLSPVFRNLVNGLWTPEGKGLLGALRYYGLDAISAKQKDAARQRVLQGWPFTPEERERILRYCISDVAALERLLRRVLPEIDHLGVALHNSEFAAASALMEHRGVPIDMEVFSQLADNDTWRAVRDAMVPTIDAQYGVYTRNVTGDWTFSLVLPSRAPPVTVCNRWWPRGRHCDFPYMTMWSPGRPPGPEMAVRRAHGGVGDGCQGLVGGRFRLPR
jgi:DNA polymerase-1